MKFIIEDKVFDILPEVCFGVVVGREIDNSRSKKEIWDFFEQSMEETRIKFQPVKPKEHPDLQPYREAFKKMGINPNKFPCSIEALTNRIVKGGSLPDINPAVNLVNAYSLRYTLPMGAHDLDATSGNIEVRFSKSGDFFIPFGQTNHELLDEEELVYACGDIIKTRKWIWRQSDRGKVTAASRNVFFPIDGFTNYNREVVLKARDALSADLQRLLNARTSVFYLDKDNREVEL